MYTDADIDMEDLAEKWAEGDRRAFVERMAKKYTRKLHNMERSWR